jgi:hypothetical protein
MEALMKQLALTSAAILSVFFFFCGKDNSGPTAPGTTLPSWVHSDYLWSTGTMGGLREINMADTVVRAISLGYDLFNYVTVLDSSIFLGGGMGDSIKRVEIFSDSTVDSISTAKSVVAGSFGRAAGMEAGAGRVWVAGTGSKALFGVNALTINIDVEIPLQGGPDSGGCAALSPSGTIMYVVTRAPLTLHAVDLVARSQTGYVVVDSLDSAGAASVAASGPNVFVYIADKHQLATVNSAGTAVTGRVTVQGIVRRDEKMAGGVPGIFVTRRDTNPNVLARITPRTGAVDAVYPLAPTTETLTEAKVFGGRVFIVLINSATGQNAVVEIDPSTMTLLHRIEHVYVSDISLQR